jgi:hypothetical protein
MIKINILVVSAQKVYAIYGGRGNSKSIQI